MFWMRAYPLRGQVGGDWALEFESILGPVKWHWADRRVPFGAHEGGFRAHTVCLLCSHNVKNRIWTVQLIEEGEMNGNNLVNEELKL